VVDLKEFPGIKRAEALKHGQLDCVVVEACRPIHTRDEREGIARALGVETSGRKMHDPHLWKAESWGFRTAWYIGEVKLEP